MPRALLLVLTLAYLLINRWAYIAFVAPNFGYLGYTYEPVGLAVEAVAFAFALAPALWLPLAYERPSQLICWFMYLSVYIPANLYAHYAFNMPPGTVLPLSIALFLGFAILCQAYRWPLPDDQPRGLSPDLFWGGVALLSIALFALVVSVFGLKASLPSLTEVYDTRFEFRDGLEASGNARFLGYAVSWLGHVIFPFLITAGLVWRRHALLAIGLAGQFYLYSITGLKGVVFSGMLLVILYVVLKDGGKRMGLWLVGGGVTVVGFCGMVDAFQNGFTWTSLFFRRMIVTPGYLTGAYYEFFSDNPKALLSHSVLEPFVEAPYALTPPRLIGQVYFHSDAVNANANVWADAYGNFGMPGILVFSLLLALCLHGYDRLARGLDFRLAALFLGISGLAFTNSALLPILLTHGFGLAMAMVAACPRPPRRAAEVAADDSLKEVAS